MLSKFNVEAVKHILPPKQVRKVIAERPHDDAVESNPSDFHFDLSEVAGEVP